MEPRWTEIASDLSYAVKNYVGLTKMIVQIANRAQAYGIKPGHEELLIGRIDKSGEPKTRGLESLKGIAERRIGRVIKDFPLWAEWMINIPGIGPVIGGQLINLYYFKSIPVCPKCGADLEDFTCPICKTEAKGQGVLKYRTELRDFPTISSWWHFMGRHVVDGKIPKRRKQKEDEEINPNKWSAVGRKLGYDFKESTNKKGGLYKEYTLKRKQYRQETHPDATKGHRHNMAWNESWKLFLSHFWQVAHILDGLPLTDPWAFAHGGHDQESIIPPYYWNGGDPKGK